MSADQYSSCLVAAHHYIARRVAVVPMRPALSERRGGKPSPIPFIKWATEGPLRRHREVEEFWRGHPSAQLAILLEKGLAAIDIDLKHLPAGGAPPGFPVPAPFPGGYEESTKSGGLHYLLRFREPLDPGKAERVTGLAGYVDVFHGGLLVVAPSRFEGARLGYVVVQAGAGRIPAGEGSSGRVLPQTGQPPPVFGGIPVFPTLRGGLAASAPWLAEAWEERWGRSQSSSAPASPRPAPAGTADAESDGPPADPAEVERALAAVRASSGAIRLFEEGARHPNGAVDRSMTEFWLAGFLKRGGFPVAATWEVIRKCAHTKSPRDPRGFTRFDRQVWERLS